ncbi:MAG: SpoIIE family protein phosphatase [Chitinispirillaceae bacterium]|nr:SpoIIE family protein phosphatase [Chitinispirillaceae bacterium]
MMAIPLSLFIIIAATLLALAVAIAIAYWKFPLHLIYKSKVGYENMLDAIGDPLAVVTSDYIVRRVNKAYVSLVSGSFQSAIGQKCHSLLRGRTEPCIDCRMPQALAHQKQEIVDRSPHPSGTGTIRLSFSPYLFDAEPPDTPCVIEHIRDITVLEQLKTDLEEKNHTLAQAMRTLKQAQRAIREDLRLARQIQEGILPKAAPHFQDFSISLTYHPVADVGGDLYDFIVFSEHKLGVFIGDASGHGLASSLIGTISKMSLFNNSKHEIPPRELIAAINRDLFMNIQTNHYLTCFLGFFDRLKQTFTYSRAGHPVPVVLRSDGTVRMLNSAGTFAGVIENVEFEEAVFSYQKGDRIFLFTDGIYEVQKLEENYFGYDKFLRVISSMHGVPFNDIIPAIEEQFSHYTYNDDYTLIVIEVNSDSAAVEDTTLDPAL